MNSVRLLTILSTIKQEHSSHPVENLSRGSILVWYLDTVYIALFVMNSTVMCTYIDTYVSQSWSAISHVNENILQLSLQYDVAFPFNKYVLGGYLKCRPCVHTAFQIQDQVSK